MFVSGTSGVNAYTSTTILFSNITFMRIFAIINDNRLLAYPENWVYNVRKVHQMSKPAISWNVPGTDTLTFKLSEVTRDVNIEYLSVFLYPTGLVTTYDDANIQFYSGPAYISHSYKSLSDTSVDVTKFSGSANAERQKLYQLFGHKAHFNDVDYDVNWIGNDANKWLLPSRTKIYFDFTDRYTSHDDAVAINNVNFEDFEIKLTCEQALSTTCEVLIYAHTKRPHVPSGSKSNKSDHPVRIAFDAPK
jgi:hypothetical protein